MTAPAPHDPLSAEIAAAAREVALGLPAELTPEGARRIAAALYGGELDLAAREEASRRGAA